MGGLGGAWVAVGENMSSRNRVICITGFFFRPPWVSLRVVAGPALGDDGGDHMRDQRDLEVLGDDHRVGGDVQVCPVAFLVGAVHELAHEGHGEVDMVYVHAKLIVLDTEDPSKENRYLGGVFSHVVAGGGNVSDGDSVSDADPAGVKLLAHTSSKKA